jgi:regulator of protease activity HflC (stomatin/prohibitin superfamily)
MSATITLFEDTLRSGWRRLARRYTRYRTAITLSPLLVLFMLVVLWPFVIITVPSGHAAVRWWRLFGGTDISHVYGEGSHFNFPWDEMPVYDVRIQQIAEDIDVLTRDGMMMTVNVAIRFRVNRDTIGLLHRNVGPDYVDTLVLPSVGTYARQTFSQYAPEDAYAAERQPIQDQIKQAVIRDLTPHVASAEGQVVPWIEVEDVLIRSMRFPPAVEAAINRKMEQYQVQKEYAYRLERERLESERKRVEAEGIAQFQRIVGAGISPDYLRWKGIDATLALAQSPNSKIVVIGSPKDGLPLILGGGETLQAAPVRAAPEPDQTPSTK